MAFREAGAGWKIIPFLRRPSFFVGLLKIYGSLYKNVDVLLFLREKQCTPIRTYTPYPVVALMIAVFSARN